VPSRKPRPAEGPRDFDFFRYEVWFALAIGALIAVILGAMDATGIYLTVTFAYLAAAEVYL
jgi:hypothetical protein